MTTSHLHATPEPVERVEADAALWVTRQHHADWSDAEQREFDAWLAASTSHRIAWLRLNRAWERSEPLAALPLPPRLATFAPNTPEAAALPRHSLWRIAAAVLLLIGAGTLAYRQFFVDRLVEYATAVGAHRDVPLADGSRLLLNTDTRLRAKVGATQRTVWLDRGEVFFDIAHDAAHPFVVEVGDRRITVLGTRFSVRREADTTTVVVVDGRVQVADARTAAPATIVTPNDVAVASAGLVVKGARRPEQIADALSWRQGKVVFDQTTLAEAAAQFNRYNARKLVLADQAAAQIRIGGRFDVDNVQAFARLLHQGFGVGVRESGQDIILSTPSGGK